MTPVKLTMKYHLCNFTIFLILFFSDMYAGDQSNIVVIDSLSGEIIRENLQNASLAAGDTVALQIDLEDSREAVYWRNLLGDILAEKSLTVFRNYNQLASFHGWVIEIARFRVTIVYSDPYSNGLFGEEFTGRTVQVFLRGQLYDAQSGRIYASIDTAGVFSDEIGYGSVAEKEISDYGFTHGSRQGYSLWEVYLEPILVVSSVAVVVLLFFTQRN
jgi:hypothetical protein